MKWLRIPENRSFHLSVKVHAPAVRMGETIKNNEMKTISDEIRYTGYGYGCLMIVIIILLAIAFTNCTKVDDSEKCSWTVWFINNGDYVVNVELKQTSSGFSVNPHDSVNHPCDCDIPTLDMNYRCEKVVGDIDVPIGQWPQYTDVKQRNIIRY